MANTQLNNDHLTPDPRHNLYYYFGLIAFSSGLFCLTILPSIAHYKFVYPEESFFITPGVFLLGLSILSWQLSKNTALYQSVTIGCGLIFFSLYQIMIETFFSITTNLTMLILCLITGITLVISAYDFFKKRIRSSFSTTLLVLSSILSVSLVIIIILKNLGYA